MDVSNQIEKAVALYTRDESELWEQVEQAVREEYDAQDAREGQIAAQAFAAYLGCDGPLDGDFECPMCGNKTDRLPDHIPKNHPEGADVQGD